MLILVNITDIVQKNVKNVLLVLETNLLSITRYSLIIVFQYILKLPKLQKTLKSIVIAVKYQNTLKVIVPFISKVLKLPLYLLYCMSKNNSKSRFQRSLTKAMIDGYHGYSLLDSSVQSSIA